MSGLIAKPIIDDQYWVVTDGYKKVGNVIADDKGYGVKLNGNEKHYESTEDVIKFTNIIFQTLPKSKFDNSEKPYNDYPTTNKVYNSMYDIKRKLHLYTKNKKSKCYFAAGWFVMEINGQKQVIFCPKYIFIQRYPYNGPYKSETEANCAINI